MGKPLHSNHGEIEFGPSEPVSKSGCDEEFDPPSGIPVGSRNKLFSAIRTPYGNAAATPGTAGG